MTVVTITAILATVAIPVFQGYVMKARTTEATEFIGVIKLRQESYRSEFSRYAQFGTTPTVYPVADADFAPGDATEMTASRSVAFPNGVNATAWTDLGAHPGGPVRFGYGIAAGLPGSQPAGLGFTPDHWYVIQAVSDLDGDGTGCLFEAYSQSKNIYFEPPKGWE
jgi:type II secretory pathway pseudopilin PulG